MIRESLEYPFAGESPIQPILITAVLLTISMLVLPFVIAVGYLMTILKETADGGKAPPSYTEWTVLARRGVNGIAVFGSYILIPILFFAIAAILVNPNISANTEPTMVDVVAILFAMVSVVVYLLLHVVLPAALAATAVTGSIKTAFDYRLLYQVVRSYEYLKKFVLGFVVIQATGGVVLAGFIFVTQGFGALLTPVIYAYIYIQIAYLIGRGYDNALNF